MVNIKNGDELATYFIVRVATTTNITLSGYQVVDEIFLGKNDLVLVKNQINETENGPYIANSGQWVRNRLFNTSNKIYPGALFSVMEGTINKATFWRLITPKPIILNVSSLIFENASYVRVGGEEQGSILYFNGSNWVQLSPGTDGYVLQTQGVGENPIWTKVEGVSGNVVVTNDFPENIDTNSSQVGVSTEAARADHKHDISTEPPSAIGSINSEGSSVSLARADHIHALGGNVSGDLSGTLPNPTVVDLTITSEEQGSTLHFNGNNWVQLSPSTDGYVLTTHGTLQNPTWAGTIPLSNSLPRDVDKSPALSGVSGLSAKADHKHNILTGTPVSIGSVNTEGTSTFLTRSDHIHEIGGTVGGDLNGTLPNPAVRDLTITSEQQGSVLYFNGSNWVQLSPSTDGYVLTTHGINENPTWTQVVSGEGNGGLPTGSAGGDLSGTYPNPTVRDLTITNEEQGATLYFNGSSWVRLAPGIDGYFLQTHGTDQNPTWAITVPLSSSLPTDITKSPALSGVSGLSARVDHKHNISTAVPSDIGSANSEGSSTALARADHIHAVGGAVTGDLSGTLPSPTVTDLTITSEVHGSVLYFNGSNWVQLSPSTDGYVLTTHSTAQNPTWTGTNPLSNSLPTDINKNPALSGVSGFAARIDHKHNVSTSSPLSIGNANSEGTSTSLVRADHVHALGGTVGGDISGTLPNPTVVDLTISGEAQGSVLYYNGSNWIQLSPGTDGYFLTTHSAGQNPTWVGSAPLSNSLPTDVTKNAALVGISGFAARSDHKHTISTAASSSITNSNTEGTAISLARSDHTHALGGTVGGDLLGTLPNPTVVDLTITSEVQGSVIYYNGSNWVQLSPGTDGYILTTRGASQNPIWTGSTPLNNFLPTDITKAPALPGVSGYAARIDHKHNISTAAPSSIGSANSEGSATSLARSDHVHAVGGTVGGDLNGTLPNPTVTDLTITSEQQGSVLYYNGSNWVQLSPSTDGYFLQTHSVSQNPTWAGSVPLSSSLPTDITKSSALSGVSGLAARIDHKHNISTSTASSVGTANAEGSSTSLARADHTHAVTDLSISSQTQGDVLYFSGSNWTRLAPGTDGSVLTTHGAGQNPSWTSVEGASISGAWPIGSIFISIVSTNPGTLLGFGTWEAFASGRVLVGLNSGDVDFDTAEETGGAKTHTLTESEIPSHTHTQNSHNHTQDAHTHTQNSHNHIQDAHTHTQDSHNHTQNAHSHIITSQTATTGGATSYEHGTLDTSSAETEATETTATTVATNQAATAVNQNATATNQSATATNQNATATNQATTATNQDTGGDGAHNNLQPYIVVYMWKRTA